MILRSMKHGNVNVSAAAVECRLSCVKKSPVLHGVIPVASRRKRSRLLSRTVSCSLNVLFLPVSNLHSAVRQITRIPIIWFCFRRQYC
jgi:hypothetical protein